MYPYCMRDVHEPRKNILEIVAAVVAMAILGACAISGLPRQTQTTNASQVEERPLDKQALSMLQTTAHELQTRDDAVEAKLAKITQLLESTRSDLAMLTEGHNKLGTEVATTTAKLQQLETTVQQTNGRMAEFSESGTVPQLIKQRDEAITQSKQSDDEVRQLTLKLQRAGVYP
jgi:predicted nuclease with TOPRIM domain